METVKKDYSVKKRLYLIATVSFALLYVLHALVLEPIYTSAISNVAVNDILSSALYYLCVIVELIAVYVCYAVAIFGAYKFGAKNFKGIILIFAVASLGKYLCKTAVSWFFVGVIPSYWYIDLLDVVYFTLLETVQLLIVWAIVSRIMAKSRGDADKEIVFSKLYDGKNPMMRSALCSSVVVFAARLLLQISNDVMTILMYGLPDRDETPILMVISYLSTLMFGVLCYLAVIFVLWRLHKRYVSES